ncbi:DUF3611 family protein [Anabaena azotica]|uniref:DUF3611 family protein n=1 Tax=Anabaena azotica FACHB-119 TaxID=947527 RepID=A0ABR8D9F7_9NOST|nr:DUF3611 family protein [Anabaena azotica]MBD2502925.1 DUF3611 family protein [Anabaena azotica FACHB-119]
MSQNPDAPSSSTNLRAIAETFRLIGWISFWIQLVLGVVSGVILLLYAASSQRTGSGGNNAGAGFGIFLALVGLAALGVGVYLAFRYTRLGRQLVSSNPSNRPRKSETVQVVRFGVIVNLVGILLTLLGAQAIVGTLATRALTQAQFLFTAQANQPFISGLDMFVVLANIQALTANFAGLSGSLWLLNRLNRP